MNRILDTYQHGPTSHPTITFQDLLGPKEQLSHAVFTALLIDSEWTEAQLPSSLQYCHLISDLKAEGYAFNDYGIQRKEQTVVKGQTSFRITHIKLPRGSMHAKLCLLKFPSFLRAVVSSSNLSDEWETIQQVVWVQDFPLRMASTQAAANDFDCYLGKVLDFLGVDRAIFPLEAYEFTKANARLVASLPGTHSERSKRNILYGHMRIRHILSSEAAWATGNRGIWLARSFSILDPRWYEVLGGFGGGRSGPS